MCRKLIFLTSFVVVLSLVGSASSQPTGNILFEYWMDIGGVQVADLTSDPRYPDSPDDSELRDKFEAPVDWADNYGIRVRGFVYPPADGDYTLWVSGDDFIELYLSTDDDPANMALVAEVAGWTSYLEWGKYPEQQSAPITLVGGQKYYIEALMKEGGGGDSLTVGWTGPEIGEELVVLDGAYLSPVLRTSARGPIPADGAVDADVVTLEWTAGDTAVSHKVYLSTDATVDESDLLGEGPLTVQFVDLAPGAAYYWRVDEVEADGTVIEGKIWSFSTIPLEAHFPNPADGAKSQPVDAQLSWTAGKVVIMHDVYFGTDEAAIAARDPSTFKGKLMDASFDPGALAIETTYYWAVDQFVPTGTVAGPVWSFTTFGAIEITDPDLLLYYDFETGEGSVAIDQSGHSNHGQFMGDPQWAAGFLGGGVSIDIATLDYIETAGSLGITSNTITVAGWVKHDELPAGWSGILTHRGSGNLGLQHDGTELRYMWGADQYWSFSSGLALPVGEWYFAALTIAPDQGKLYLNGVEQTATNVAPHDPVNFDSLIRVGRDHNDGRIMTSLIDEVRLYNKTLTDVEILKLMGSTSDVTAPGDVVKGVPDEPRDGSVAGWPDGEYPGLAVDDDVSTKYLHFKGEVEPTGFVVAPASNPSIVTGLTFTTANDATERDPISFELSGSNDSIDGPYTLIASGDIVDFAQADAWPRFTMNATAITFDNNVAYTYYQVMFPTVRDPGSANSMQIAEVELLGVPAPIARWEFDGDFGGGTPVGDIAFEDDPVRGTVLSLPGGDDQYVDLGPVGISGNMPRTITVWAKADNTDIPNWTLIFGFTGTESGDGGNGSHFNIGSLGGPGGVGAHVWGWEETIFSDEEALEWHHYAMSYDGTTIQYYGDGDLMDTDPGKSNVRDLSISADRVHVGSRITQASSFPGKVDDARIYNQVLSQAEIRVAMKWYPSATGVNIIWVSDFYDDDGDGVTDDIGWVELLEAQGHTVDYTMGDAVGNGYWRELDDDKIAALNAADLIIVSRCSNSGDYDDGDEVAQWNSVTTPIMLQAMHIVRSSRWRWLDTTSLVGLAPMVEILAPDNPIFAGVTSPVQIMDETMGSTNFPDITGVGVGNGTLLAQVVDTGEAWIVVWEPGVEFYAGSGEIAGGPRMVFTAGTQDVAGVTGRGMYNLTPEGETIFLNAVNSMLPAPYVYDGDALDDTWVHDNGSDQWDGTGPGEGNPGGAAALTEDGVTFLRIQDTGDPRDYGMGDPGSNRKVYLTRLTDISLDGLRLEVRVRVATTAPLDDAHPNGGAGIEPWPAEGIGYHIRDGGKGMFGVSDGVGIISFSLAQAGEPMFEDVTTDVLVMNSLVGTDPTSDVDTEDAAAAVAMNMMVVDDATQWNTFVIDIVAGGAGTHVVSVSVNGGPAELFDVTLGSDLEADGPFITIGSSGTGGITAFDVDYLSVQ